MARLGVSFSNLFRDGSWRGCRVHGVCIPPPPPLSRSPVALWYNWYCVLKFVYVISQLRHSSVVYPLLRKILDPPLFLFSLVIIWCTFCLFLLALSVRTINKQTWPWWKNLTTGGMTGEILWKSACPGWVRGRAYWQHQLTRIIPIGDRLFPRKNRTTRHPGSMVQCPTLEWSGIG